MGERPAKRKFRRRHGRLVQMPTAREFVEALEQNEEVMPEGAAMAVTCEQFGISEEHGFDLLISLTGEEIRP